MTVEEHLREYRKEREAAWDGLESGAERQEDRISRIVCLSGQTLYRAEEEGELSWAEFLWQQAGYIRKYWWVLQFLLLAGFWVLLRLAGTAAAIQRNMGVLAALFVIMAMPELWKNQSCGAMEIEGAAYYSLRRIYSARLCLFGMADVLLLTLFCGAVSGYGVMSLREMLVQFILPLNVNCCICFRILCSGRLHSEYGAVVVSILWSAVWSLFIHSDRIFAQISAPVWGGSIVISVAYLAFCIRKLLGRQVSFCL